VLVVFLYLLDIQWHLNLRHVPRDPFLQCPNIDGLAHPTGHGVAFEYVVNSAVSSRERCQQEKNQVCACWVLGAVLKVANVLLMSCRSWIPRHRQLSLLVVPYSALVSWLIPLATTNGS
jgi:hypothetical protein